MGVQNFCDKEPHWLLRGGSRATREQITVSDLTNRLHYCVILAACTQFTNVEAGRDLGVHFLSAIEVRDFRLPPRSRRELVSSWLLGGA